MRMIKLTDLIQRILVKHIDPYTKTPELILLGYCSNETASEHISRYYLASKFAHGVVLDVASGTCYGSSILKRARGVKMVISVDIDRDVLRYGRIVYDADYVCADATHLPFRKQAFDSVVSLETLEHIRRDQKAFLDNIKGSLKKGGKLILSTPNKMYSSLFLPKPLNPYHTAEFYLGPLLDFLRAHDFRVDHIYGGRRVKRVEFLRRIFGSLLKFFLNKFSLKPYLLDDFYHSINLILVCRWRHSEKQYLIDPDPGLFMHEEVRSRSNIVLYQYFLICAQL